MKLKKLLKNDVKFLTKKELDLLPSSFYVVGNILIFNSLNIIISKSNVLGPFLKILTLPNFFSTYNKKFKSSNAEKFVLITKTVL